MDYGRWIKSWTTHHTTGCDLVYETRRWNPLFARVLVQTPHPRDYESMAPAATASPLHGDIITGSSPVTLTHL